MRPLFLFCLLAVLCTPCPAAPVPAEVKAALNREAAHAELLDNNPKRARAYKTLVAALDKIASGQPANTPNKAGHTPLMLAVRLDRLDAAEWLLHRGANPLLKNRAGKCALDMAKNDRMRQLLNDNAPIMSIEQALAFLEARKNETKAADQERYDKLLDGFKQWQREGGVPPGALLCRTVDAGYRPLAAFLIAQGADVNFYDKKDPDLGSPLTLAVQADRQDLVDLLLDSGADIDKRTYWGSPLLQAIYHESLFKHLVERGATIDLTAYGNHTSFIRELVSLDSPKLLELSLNKAGGCPCELNPWNILFASVPCYRWLAAHGFDARKPDDQGNSLLFYSMALNHKLFVYLLESLSPTMRELEREFLRLEKINSFGINDNTRRNIALLLKRGVNINARDERGRTILHGTAAEHSSNDAAESVAFLLQLGADPTIRDKEGKRPADLVRERPDSWDDKQKIIDLLSATSGPGA